MKKVSLAIALALAPLAGGCSVPGYGALAQTAARDLDCTRGLQLWGATRKPLESPKPRWALRYAADGRQVIDEGDVAGCGKHAYYALTCKNWLADDCAWKRQPAWAPFYWPRLLSPEDFAQAQISRE